MSHIRKQVILWVSFIRKELQEVGLFVQQQENEAGRGRVLDLCGPSKTFSFPAERLYSEFTRVESHVSTKKDSDLTINTMHRFTWIMALCLTVVSLGAQDVESLLEGQAGTTRLGVPFALDGSFGVSFRSYQAWDIADRQTPLASSISANATIRSYQLTIPFSFIMHNLDEVDHPFTRAYWKDYLSNQRNRFTRFGASPYYKWITLHAGHRYMDFSEFTLANHNFLGAGLDLTPGKWRIAAMGGRLARAEPQSRSLRTPFIQQYTRTGWGAHVAYGDTKDRVGLSLFSAKEDPASLVGEVDSQFLVTPLENLVISLNGKKTIRKYLSIEFEIAQSALTRNAGDPDDDQGFFLYRSFLFQRKTSTDLRHAANVKLDYSRNDFRAGLEYRRIDAGYRSLGAYFFNDDLENYTAYTNFSLMKKTLHLQIQGGLQRNNLDGTKQASFERLIGSANAAYRLKNWVLGASLSNFSSRVDYQLSQELDSLNVVVVSREASLTGSRSFLGKSGNSATLTLVGGVQTVEDGIDNPDASAASNLYYANVNYSVSTPTHWRFGATTDVNHHRLSGLSLSRYGGGLQAGKEFLGGKVLTGIGSNIYLQTSTEGLRQTLWSHFLRGSWQVMQQHALHLQVNLLTNHKKLHGTTQQFSELMAVIGYNVQFGYHPFASPEISVTQ